jgi:hypothetical protein
VPSARSLSSGRRSGRVTTLPYPPPKPSVIVALCISNRKLLNCQPACRVASRAFRPLVLFQASDPARRKSSDLGQRVCPLESRNPTHCEDEPRCHATRSSRPTAGHLPAITRFHKIYAGTGHVNAVCVPWTSRGSGQEIAVFGRKTLFTARKVPPTHGRFGSRPGSTPRAGSSPVRSTLNCKALHQ